MKIEESIADSSSLFAVGRPMASRKAFARAFVAKVYLQYPTSKALRNNLLASSNLARICGFEGAMPSESTFSRVFAEFSRMDLGTKVHNKLVCDMLGSTLIGHVSRDSTAIAAREKPASKVKVAKKQGKRGRPRAKHIQVPKKETRLEMQAKQLAKESLAQLPRYCDRGVKRNAKGFTETWNGYKLHVDVADTGLPITAIITAASVHDSQVAIPMMQMTYAKVTSLYDLMDAAYDAKPIHDFSRKLGHVPIIDRNKRRKKNVAPMCPHEKERYKERSAVERFNSSIKDTYGARFITVKGISKVTLHLMLVAQLYL